MSVPSYRDPEAPHTIADMFEKASDPSRVHVGACFQCDDVDDAGCDDLSSLRAEWRENVRVIRMDWRRARGPVWARAAIQAALFDDEDYYLQVDSHTRFAEHWDATLLRMVQRCGSPKAVISAYPLPYRGLARRAMVSEEMKPTLLCTQAAERAFDADGECPARSAVVVEARLGATWRRAQACSGYARGGSPRCRDRRCRHRSGRRASHSPRVCPTCPTLTHADPAHATHPLLSSDLPRGRS